MYEREMPCEANLLSAFALMIGGALGTGLPMALVIIWLCSCDLARDKTGATGEHTGRRLRELTEEGILEVQYRRGHAFYRLKEAVPQLFQ